jgi:hypothetical protein
MKAKRAKQYRKLMQQYGLTFGFREPYQVLVDAQMLQDADRFKMDIVKGLERTLSGKVKPSTSFISRPHTQALIATSDHTMLNPTPLHRHTQERRSHRASEDV